MFPEPPPDAENLWRNSLSYFCGAFVTKLICFEWCPQHYFPYMSYLKKKTLNFPFTCKSPPWTFTLMWQKFLSVTSITASNVWMRKLRKNEVTLNVTGRARIQSRCVWFTIIITQFFGFNFIEKSVDEDNVAFSV